MSEQLLEQMLDQMRAIKSNMATKKDLENFATKQDIEKIDNKLEIITKQVATNTEMLSELCESQKRQDKILETLSLRSIEHESEIREIKRIK